MIANARVTLETDRDNGKTSTVSDFEGFYAGATARQGSGSRNMARRSRARRPGTGSPANWNQKVLPTIWLKTFQQIFITKSSVEIW